MPLAADHSPAPTERRLGAGRRAAVVLPRLAGARLAGAFFFAAVVAGRLRDELPEADRRVDVVERAGMSPTVIARVVPVRQAGERVCSPD
ncbi:hypothetical protein GCM10011381_40890 [Klenkia taihuensis]|nr:hypothetical protein GCM10011381_40890 [Klenkia taihuensis]